MKRLLAAVFSVVLFAQVLIAIPLTSPAYAAVAGNCDKSAALLSIPTWYKYLDVQMENGSCTVKVPMVTSPDGTQHVDIAAVVVRVALAIVEIALRIGGLVAVGFVIFGGFKFILSNGEPDKAAGARNTIINALVGLVIAILATAIVNFLGSAIK